MKKVLKNWWLFALFGIIFIGVGILIFVNYEKSYVALALLFAIVVLASGFANLFYTISNWKYLDGRGWILASSVFEVAVGLVLISYPEINMVVLPIVIGFWMMFRAFFLIGTSYVLKDFGYLDWGWMMGGGILLLILSFLVVVYPIIGASLVVAVTAISFLTMGVSYIALGINLKKVKSATLDVYENFKKELKDAMDDAVKEAETRGDSSATSTAE